MRAWDFLDACHQEVSGLGLGDHPFVRKLDEVLESDTDDRVAMRRCLLKISEAIFCLRGTHHNQSRALGYLAEQL